jgi:hypothetical protein
LYHLSIPQNEAPHYVLISLSLSKLILQKRHGYRKEIWTYEGPSEKKEKNGHMKVQVKKEKKVGHMKVQEKRKDSHVHKRVKRERGS